MDYIINHTNEEQIFSGSIINSIEQINEAINPEGDFTLLDNNYTSNKKDIESQKLMNKSTKEEKLLNNIISNEKKILNLPEPINNKSEISSIIDRIKKENLGKKRKKKMWKKKIN